MPGYVKLDSCTRAGAYRVGRTIGVIDLYMQDAQVVSHDHKKDGYC